jgi:hypothetical protein
MKLYVQEFGFWIDSQRSKFFSFTVHYNRILFKKFLHTVDTSTLKIQSVGIDGLNRIGLLVNLIPDSEEAVTFNEPFSIFWNSFMI